MYGEMERRKCSGGELRKPMVWGFRVKGKWGGVGRLLAGKGDEATGRVSLDIFPNSYFIFLKIFFVFTVYFEYVRYYNSCIHIYILFFVNRHRHHHQDESIVSL